MPTGLGLEHDPQVAYVSVESRNHAIHLFTEQRVAIFAVSNEWLDLTGVGFDDDRAGYRGATIQNREEGEFTGLEVQRTIYPFPPTSSSRHSSDAQPLDPSELWKGRRLWEGQQRAGHLRSAAETHCVLADRTGCYSKGYNQILS